MPFLPLDRLIEVSDALPSDCFDICRETDFLYSPRSPSMLVILDGCGPRGTPRFSLSLVCFVRD